MPLRIACAALLALVGVSAPHTSRADSKESFVYLLTSVKTPPRSNPKLEAMVEEALRRKIDAAERLELEVPEDAPDADTDPDGFTKYMLKRRMRTFRVNAEVSEFSLEVEDHPAQPKEKLVVVRFAMHLFGETVPDRTFAFTGDGSATIKMGVGKTARKKDKELGVRDAVELAVDDAIAVSLKKLDAGPETSKKKKKR